MRSRPVRPRAASILGGAYRSPSVASVWYHLSDATVSGTNAMTEPEAPDSNGAFTPQQIAERVESLGVAKARTNAFTLLVLALLAGAFISLGALFFTLIVTGSEAGFGLTRLIGGVGFCLGLILVVVAGAELFTGNNLIAMAWASRLVSTRDLLRNWVIVYVGNVLGCLGTVALAIWSDLDALGGGAFGETALRVAQGKADLDLGAGFARGVLCNALVCLAVWLAMGGRSVFDKVVAILFPITAFVALGLEHSIANWFFLPYAMALETSAASGAATISLDGALRNLGAVTAGNIVGGTLLVAGVYWMAYLRNGRRA